MVEVYLETDANFSGESTVSRLREDLPISYVTLIAVDHGVMRTVADPARKDPLARRRWEATDD